MYDENEDHDESEAEKEERQAEYDEMRMHPSEGNVY